MAHAAVLAILLYSSRSCRKLTASQHAIHVHQCEKDTRLLKATNDHEIMYPFPMDCLWGNTCNATFHKMNYVRAVGHMASHVSKVHGKGGLCKWGNCSAVYVLSCISMFVHFLTHRFLQTHEGGREGSLAHGASDITFVCGFHILLLLLPLLVCFPLFIFIGEGIH